MVYQASDDAATLVCYFGADSKVDIPAELGGKPVTSIGDYAFWNCRSLTKVTIPEGVTSIGESAFQYCISLTEVNIPKSVETIGDEAFETCDSLTEVTIPEGVTSIGVYAFKFCNSLTEVTIPEGVTSIGDGAFESCRSLTEVTISEGVTSIGETTFAGCRSLTEVTIPKSVTSIGGSAFQSCSSLTKATIPEGVTSIRGSVFEGCSSLREVTIPKSVTSIESHAFYNCGALATVYYGGTQEDWDALKKNISEYNTPLLNANIIYSENSSDYAYSVNDAGDGVTITKYNGAEKTVVIPSELGGKPVTAIGNEAFLENTTITSVTIPEGVTSIGSYAFKDCTSLTKVKIPKGVTSIGAYAFIGCSSLTEVKIPEGVTSIGKGVFNSCRKLTEVTIPESVTSIGEDAFAGCSSLTEVKIPEGVTSIGNGAFGYCRSLTEVTIPKSVTSIGGSAFEGCSSLTKVIIPEGVTSIGKWAFLRCSSLTEVTIPKSVTSIEAYAFSECKALTTVHYGGTQEDWDALKKNIGEENAPLVNANIICAIQESNGFEYTVTGDEATITGYTGSAKSLVIPSELGGKPVTAIADKAFEGYKNIVNIYIPKTIKAIGEDAFQNATSNLIRFICYEGTENEWANIAIQKGNSELNPREFDDVAWFRLYECNLSGDMVYQASDDAATLVRYFGSDSKVDIPAELGGKPVTEIGEWAFAYCSSLTEVTIPKSVTSIRAFAFRSCSSLTKVIIPEGVTSIGDSAFGYCSSLTEVTIPKSVTSIEYFAFCDCGALATVYYGGTQEDWEALKKNIGEGNDPLLNANIICKEKPKICKGGKEVKISDGVHEMRIHGKSYGTFTFAWVNDKAGWSIQNADGKYLSFDNGKLVLRDTAYVWKYDAKFYTKTEEKTSFGWGWWGRPSTKVTNWYLVGDGTDLSISKSDTNADVKLYDAMESTEHSFGKWTPAEDDKHTRTCTICGATETGDCTYENGACTVCGALDPDNASVSVSATVTKRTSGGGGWWWWNRPTTTTWEARITATGTGVDIDKVEYSDDGKHYLTGTSFTSDTEITKFYIRVTDSKGNVTNWLYENGKVTQK